MKKKIIKIFLLPLAILIVLIKPLIFIRFFWISNNTLGHFLIILSLKLGEASKLAPLGYFEISTNILVGYVFFNDLPDIWIYSGLLLITFSGFYIFLRENRN